jgi:hypothetical protein
MNQADILKLSKDAGISTRNIINGDSETIYMEHLTRFAELVAQHERAEAYKREQEIVRLACLAAADQAREHQKEIEAVRNRERKE